MEVSQRPSERLEVAPPPAEALLHPDDEPSPRFRTLTGFNQSPFTAQVELPELEIAELEKGEAAALDLVAAEFAVVKTVRNGDWLRLLSNLSHPPFRTSFSLLPPTGRMHLFGQTEQQCCGLLFDRREMDFASALCWPSGYFAKTEHHLHVEPDGSITLTGGRWSHLVSLDALLQGGAPAAAGPPSPAEAEAPATADAAEETLRDAHDGEPPLYNEISINVTGHSGLAAVFVRTSSPEDTLFAMGVRALLQHLFPQLPPLPLLRMLGTADAAIVHRDEQVRLLRRQSQALAAAVDGTPAAAADDDVNDESAETPAPRVWDHLVLSAARLQRQDSNAGPRLPIDASAFPELSLDERLALHAAHGIGHRSLKATFDGIVRKEGSSRLAPHVAHALCAAAIAENVASAREIVRTAAPLLLETVLKSGHSLHDGGATSGASSDGEEEPGGGGSASIDSSSSGSGQLTRTAVLQSITTLQRACSAERSEAMLVALGAQITLQEFVAGRTALRLRKACSWLRGWCAKAEAGICSPASLIFLATSWAEARKVDGNSDWLSFLNGKAFINRLAFHDQLLTLLAAQEEGDGLRYIEQLYMLSSKLRKPCLRLRILQQILGLDTRFSRDIVHGVVCLAFDVLEDMSNVKKSGKPRAPPGESPLVDRRQPSTSDALELDEFDEATRLEADALLGGEGVPRRPSDPLGEEGRHMRVKYYYR